MPLLSFDPCSRHDDWCRDPVARDKAEEEIMGITGYNFRVAVFTRDGQVYVREPIVRLTNMPHKVAESISREGFSWWEDNPVPNKERELIFVPPQEIKRIGVTLLGEAYDQETRT